MVVAVEQAQAELSDLTEQLQAQQAQAQPSQFCHPAAKTQVQPSCVR